MIGLVNQQDGLRTSPAAAASDAVDLANERERLRRELLKRIMIRESKRRSTRGPTRLP